MTDMVFVDTNILVYTRDAAVSEKHRTARALVAELWKNRTGRISVQVLNEYFVTVTRKLRPGLDEAAAWEDLELYSSWDPIPINYRLLRTAREIQLRYGLAWWDSLIVAAALQADCGRIVSGDLNPAAKNISASAL